MVVSNCWTLLCWAFRISALPPTAWTCEDWCQNLLDPLFMRTVLCRRAHWTKLLNDSMEIISIFGDHHLICEDSQAKSIYLSAIVAERQHPGGKPKKLQQSLLVPNWKRYHAQPFAVDIPHIILSTKLLLCMSFKPSSTSLLTIFRKGQTVNSKLPSLITSVSQHRSQLRNEEP